MGSIVLTKVSVLPLMSSELLILAYLAHMSRKLGSALTPFLYNSVSECMTSSKWRLSMWIITFWNQISLSPKEHLLVTLSEDPRNKMAPVSAHCFLQHGQCASHLSNRWQKQLKRGCIYVSSQFQSIANVARKSRQPDLEAADHIACMAHSLHFILPRTPASPSVPCTSQVSLPL